MSAPHREGTDEVIGSGDDRTEPERLVGRSWLALALAFALGILVGAAGWDRWRDSSEERARRSALTIRAELGTVFGPSANELERTISVVARLWNTGPLPVEIVQVELEIAGLVTPPTPNTFPAALTLDPGTAQSVRLARILRCEELAVAGDEPLVVRARTTDGQVQERRLVLTEAVQRLGEFARSQCERR